MSVAFKKPINPFVFSQTAGHIIASSIPWTLVCTIKLEGCSASVKVYTSHVSASLESNVILPLLNYQTQTYS